jgi:hypothetical protein
MNQRQELLRKCCSLLGLELILDFVVILKVGARINSTALLPELGGSKGMVVVDSFQKVANVRDQLIAEGYGFSVLDEPTDGFDLQVQEEMFADWGWAISNKREPAWMAAARKRRSPRTRDLIAVRPWRLRRVRRVVEAGRGLGEDLMPVFGHRHRVLELR